MAHKGNELAGEINYTNSQGKGKQTMEKISLEDFKEKLRTVNCTGGRLTICDDMIGTAMIEFSDIYHGHKGIDGDGQCILRDEDGNGICHIFPSKVKELISFSEDEESEGYFFTNITKDERNTGVNAKNYVYLTLTLYK